MVKWKRFCFLGKQNYKYKARVLTSMLLTKSELRLVSTALWLPRSGIIQG